MSRFAIHWEWRDSVRHLDHAKRGLTIHGKVGGALDGVMDEEVGNGGRSHATISQWSV